MPDAEYLHARLVALVQEHYDAGGIEAVVTWVEQGIEADQQVHWNRGWIEGRKDAGLEAMPEPTPPTDLREQVMAAIGGDPGMDWMVDRAVRVVDDFLRQWHSELRDENEQLRARHRILRERIEALDVNEYSDAARPRVAAFKRRVLALLEQEES
jgi:hypothetical protein